MHRASIASLVFLACLPAIAFSAAPSPEGRWEGLVQIPGNELPVTVDLAQSGGSWVGSIVIPGLGIKGAPLANVVANDSEVSFDLGNLLANPTHGPARFKARAVTGDRMTGEMRQAGNVAIFVLAKRGPAQVDAPVRSTPIARELEAQWTGDFELGGYSRQVTLTLENRVDAGATAKLVIVGKRVNDLPVDLVVQQGRLLRIESQTRQVVFEGRVREDGGEIRGAIELGSIELPLTLRRAKGAS